MTHKASQCVVKVSWLSKIYILAYFHASLPTQDCFKRQRHEANECFEHFVASSLSQVINVNDWDVNFSASLSLSPATC